MTLQTLILYIAVVAVILTLITGYLKKGQRSWVMTFLQHFTGVLFIISGLVKAVDPMGTAFKMEQYFTEFEYTLAESALSFLAPLFPALSSISVLFSVVMIIFEIVLGVMLILGHRTRLTGWLFLLLVLFFTVLTGFTFLTGYVPSGVNFFQFSAWGPYTATNMRVTDCGCFGDFIKLEPRISFYKDLVLLVPAFLFVFRYKQMHELLTPRIRAIIVGSSLAALLLFCLRNTIWDEPIVDFRPFAVGTDLYTKKQQEEEAMASVQIIAWKLQNKSSGEVKELPHAEYMANLAAYPKDQWTVVEQVKSKPAVEPTKVSEFSVIDADGFDVAEDILSDSGHVFLVIAYKLKGEARTESVAVPDTAWMSDTLVVSPDSIVVTRRPGTIGTRQETREVYAWDPGYVSQYAEKVNKLMDDVTAQGARVYAIAGGAGGEKLASFREATGGTYTWYEADDILLKTILRSNPGVLHLKGGKVLHKWHIRHLPQAWPLEP